MFLMLLSLGDVLLLVQFINQWELHCWLRNQVLIFSILALSVAGDWYLYIFHPCKFILTFAVLAFSILRNCAISYFPFPYLHFPIFALSAPPIQQLCARSHPLTNSWIQKATNTHWVCPMISQILARSGLSSH